MIFRQRFDASSATYTNLLGDRNSGEALLIDPVAKQRGRDLALLGELGLTLRYATGSHIHANHVSTAGKWRRATGRTSGEPARARVDCADLSLREGDRLTLGHLALTVIKTPRHTDTCLSYYTPGKASTGAALPIRAYGHSDCQSGDAAALYDCLTHQLDALPNATQVSSERDDRACSVSSSAQKKHHNPRLNLVRKGGLRHLQAPQLPHPTRRHIALPANRGCGRAPAA